ncbi:MAG: hypothetical protein HOH20_09805 [Rhodospirillaceae bacterium]|nr:hypothetical protein [Rhodospirillaceae bacterium]MBT5565529.1 hypothetical protein [Rhodospirillaceae bacterium]MBT6089859.1 hypothetical protein [Rhodospirillaceae bacterium]MBT6962046.1 hypothetical protein [Rhodospirillaceae bacterium]
MKDIAIYRLQRVEKALERLGTAVNRLESATTRLDVKDIEQDDGPKEGEQFNLLQAELDAIRADYEQLHSAASQVADRLDDKIELLGGTAQSALA